MLTPCYRPVYLGTDRSLTATLFRDRLLGPAARLQDVKAATSAGTLLAWPGWRLLVADGFPDFLLAAIYGIVLLVSGRASRKLPSG